MRIKHVSRRTTTDGIPWSVIAGEWHGHQPTCVAFPTVWALGDQVKAGDAAVIKGNLARRDGRAVVLVRDLSRWG
jgi:hypothetical protein